MTEHAKLDRLLHIILNLSGIRAYSIEEICKRFEISKRTAHRYISTIREAGFVVDCNEGAYLIPKNGHPFKELHDLLHFSEEEA